MKKLTLQEQTTLLFNTWKTMERLYNQYAKTLGMTYQSLTILDMIYNSTEICTQKTICGQTHLPKQSVNVTIKNLWKQGYITLHELASDRRNKSIELTSAGKKYAEEAIGKILGVEQEILGQLSYSQRQELIEILQKTTISLGKMVQDECIRNNK